MVGMMVPVVEKVVVVAFCLWLAGLELFSFLAVARRVRQMRVTVIFKNVCLSFPFLCCRGLQQRRAAMEVRPAVAVALSALALLY
jgi:hypothetical protein